MEQLRYECRIEKKIQKHAIIAEFNLGDDHVCVQCLGCGVIGVVSRADAQ